MRETKTAEKRLINKPKMSVTAKPLIAPEPNIHKITDEIIAVELSNLSPVEVEDDLSPVEVNHGRSVADDLSADDLSPDEV